MKVVSCLSNRKSNRHIEGISVPFLLAKFMIIFMHSQRLEKKVKRVEQCEKRNLALISRN